MMKVKEKVLIYFYRQRQTLEILVFDHRDDHEQTAGVQVIGGTVEPGEASIEAMMREIEEESGIILTSSALLELGNSQYIRKDLPEINHRTFFAATGEHLPEHWSHQVHSNGEDNAMWFEYYWVSIDRAKEILTGNMGELLPLLVKVVGEN